MERKLTKNPASNGSHPCTGRREGENWLGRRTGQEGELVEEGNWSRRGTGQEGELVKEENWSRRRTG